MKAFSSSTERLWKSSAVSRGFASAARARATSAFGGTARPAKDRARAAPACGGEAGELFLAGLHGEADIASDGRDIDKSRGDAVDIGNSAVALPLIRLDDTGQFLMRRDRVINDAQEGAALDDLDIGQSHPLGKILGLILVIRGFRSLLKGCAGEITIRRAEIIQKLFQREGNVEPPFRPGQLVVDAVDAFRSMDL